MKQNITVMKTEILNKNNYLLSKIVLYSAITTIGSLSSCTTKPAVVEGTKANSAEPVSYTHLDVYKRQLMTLHLWLNTLIQQVMML